MIAILSDDSKQNMGNIIYESIRSKGEPSEYISTSILYVKPCYNCGGCATKTYGKCVLNDDMDALLRKLIRADKLILVTPVEWGSYSFNTKKVLDRTSIIGDIHYYAKKGELVKGMRSNIKRFFAVGVKDSCSGAEAEVFKKLVQENNDIMKISGKAFIVGRNSDADTIAEEVCG